MILEHLQMIRATHGEASPVLQQTIDDISKRYEKLCDDIAAAAAIDGNDRVVDLIEEEMEE